MNSARHFGGRFRQQSHNRKRGDSLATAGLANQAQGLSTPDRQIEAFDGVSGAAVAMKNDLEIFNLQKRIGDKRLGGAHEVRTLAWLWVLACAWAWASLLSIMSRSVMPTRSLRRGSMRMKCTKRSRLTLS